MSASKSIPSQPAPALQLYRYGTGINEASEDQWSPDTTNVHSDPTPIQWTTMQQHTMVPVSCNGTNAPYEPPKFSSPGITTPIDLDNPNCFAPITDSQSQPNGYHMLNTPRMTQSVNSSSLLLNPSLQNPMINGRSAWMAPVSSTSQFVTRAPAWNVTKTGGVKKPKRIRTAFTSQQMMELEQEYTRTRYLDRSRRIELAKILHLNERTIKIWFQNRRMKEKKDRAESLEDSEETTESSPEHGHLPAPILVHQDFPTPVADAIFKQEGVYLEQYPETQTPMPMPPHLPLPNSMDNQMITGYAYEYPQDQHLAFEYRHMHLHNDPSEYVEEMQAMTPQFREESPQSVDQGAAAANAIPVADVQSTDISWIRNIYPDEEC